MYSFYIIIEKYTITGHYQVQPRVFPRTDGKDPGRSCWRHLPYSGRDNNFRIGILVKYHWHSLLIRQRERDLLQFQAKTCSKLVDDKDSPVAKYQESHKTSSKKKIYLTLPHPEKILLCRSKPEKHIEILIQSVIPIL